MERMTKNTAKRSPLAFFELLKVKTEFNVFLSAPVSLWKGRQGVGFFNGFRNRLIKYGIAGPLHEFRS